MRKVGLEPDLPFKRKAPDLQKAQSVHLQRTVYVYVNVFSVSNIDTAAQQFDCHFYIRAMWVEPEDENWEPHLMFMNAQSAVEMNDEKHHLCTWRSGQHDEKVMQWSADCRGCFREQFELRHFPFDVQALTVTVSCKHALADVKLLEDRFDDVESILRNQFSPTTDFALSGPFMEPGTDKARERYPLLHITFVGERRAANYMWNIVLPSFLLSCLAFTTFSIPQDEAADRLSVSLTLLLTSVAFKHMVSQELPRISYLTLLDTYILLSFAFLALVGGQNAFAALFTDAESFPFEEVSFYVVGIIFLVIHLVVGTLSLRFIYLESSKRARLVKRYEPNLLE